MLNAIRRLSLGLLLLALTSAVLLMSDWSRRTAGPRKVPKIAVLQHASSPVLDDGIRGLIEGLGARGYRDGERITIQRFNAQGDMATDVAIARQVTTGDYDLVVTSSTPAMQAVANNNRDGKVRHVFFLVADPFAAGVGLDRAAPLKHAPHMVGQGALAPVDRSMQLAKQSLPSLRRVGVAWNPAEANSAVFTSKLRDVTGQMGLELLEANIDGTAAVTDAVNALISRGAQMIWIGGDNSMMSSIDTVVAVARRGGVPVITVLPGQPDRGTLIDCGPDFVAVGRLAAHLVADVLEGADMAKIPIRDVMDLVPPFVSVNAALTGFREAWAIPDAIRREASIVVDETGIHRKAAPGGPARTDATTGR